MRFTRASQEAKKMRREKPERRGASNFLLQLLRMSENRSAPTHRQNRLIRSDEKQKYTVHTALHKSRSQTQKQEVENFQLLASTSLPSKITTNFSYATSQEAVFLASSEARVKLIIRVFIPERFHETSRSFSENFL